MSKIVEPETKNIYYKSFSNFRNNAINVDNFSIMQINIRGINDYSKFEKFKLMISSLNYKFDVMVIGETKLKSTFPKSLYNLTGYDMYISCRKCFKNSKGKSVGGGGLLLYVKKDIIVTNHETYSTSFEKISFNMCLNKQKLKLVTYYRPPESQKIRNIDDFIADVEKEISDEKERIMLVGDVNIDVLDNCKYAKEYKNLMGAYNMKIVNKNVTRDVSEKIIDHVAINFDDKCHIFVHTISLDKNFTDHNMIITTIEDMKVLKPKPQWRSYDRLDYEKLNEHMNDSQKLKDILRINDVNVIAQSLTEITQDAIKSCTTKFRIKTKNENNLIPWLNRRIKKVQDEKRKIRKKLKRKRYCQETKEQFKIISQKLKMTIKTEEKKFCYKNLMVKDPKVLWRNLNSILGKKSNDVISSICDTNGKIMMNKAEIAESFNQYFIESVNETVSSISESRKSFKFISLPNSMGLDETDEMEVKNAINSLKNVSAGNDGIKPQVVKFLQNHLSLPMCHLINRMFLTGIYPDIFKTAIVIPINKSGKKNDISDYRPVSILNSFNKIVEKVLYRRIMNFVTKNKIIYCKQYGFREKSNTEVAAIELIHDIRQNLDKKKKVSLIMMDVKKAFDSVSTCQLVKALERSGIRGIVLNLIKNYLTNRKQVVKVGEHISKPRNVSNGVVQGGTLGSLLFLIFINEMSQISLNGTLYLYADDALILNTHEKNDQIDGIVRNDVRKVIDFLNTKRLALNETKTTYMIIHSPYQKLSDSDEITVNDHFTMKRCTTAKYLGLVLDEHLKFDEHCKLLESKLTSSAGILWRMRNKLPVHIKKTIYHTLFESHLLYMNTLWGNACENVIKPLQSIQNRALRSVFNLERRFNRIKMYSHHVENCLPIRGINYLLTSTYIYKNLHGNILSNIKLSKTINRRGRSSQQNEIQCSSSNSHYGHKSITSFGVKIFNNLPTDLKNLKHPAAFKWALRCHLRKESFLSSCFSNDYLRRYC
jgi:hypothetical protein